MADANTFPISAVQPKNETQALDFIKSTGHDGDGVVVAVFDTGVDPGTVGLQKTPSGKPKIVDIIDATGSGDVDTTTIVKVKDENGVKTITGLTGRKLTLTDQFNSPNGEYRVGVKAAFTLYPDGLETRVKAERKKDFDEKQRLLIESLNRQLQTATATSAPPKSELEARLEVAKSLSFSDPGPIYDVVLFKNPEGRWKAALDVSQTGDLSATKLMGEYRFDQEFSALSKLDMLNYSFNVYSDGAVLSIVTNAGSHGTHVASIIGAYHPEDNALNGVAPGCQILAIKIGDHRIGSMETGVGLVRGIIAAKNLKADIINMSYGEPSSRAHHGRIIEMANELVNQHGVIFVASAGNNGPALSTIGAPGGFASGVIGVGAVVSPDMSAVQYSLRQPIKSPMLYTWSSRGPVEDGDLGVSICAPGGAITGVPNWTLSKSQLMNGTSMSSPNAAGCIALMLSGLKAKKLAYSPWLVRRALENTADASLAPNEPLSRGFGMVQVQKAFKWLEANQWPSNIRYEAVLRDHHSHKARGLYLREPHQLKRVVNESVEVTPFWNDEVDPELKIKFEKRILIKTTSPDWVQVPEFFVLNNHTRTFVMNVNPLLLKGDPHSGTVFHAQVIGMDAENPDQGPLFVIPITVIKPVTFDGQQPPFKLSYPELPFNPTTMYRKYFIVPEGASIAEIKFKPHDFENRLMSFSAQLLRAPHSSAKFSLVDKYIRFELDTERVEFVPVTAGRTLEVVLAQFWSSLGDKGTVDMTVEFRGFQVDTRQVTLSTFEAIQRINVRLVAGTSESLQPAAKLAIVQRSLFPSSSVIKPLSGERDKWHAERQIYQLVNSYALPVWEGVTKYITRVPNLSEVLYDSPYESQMWMVFDENKQCVASGDAWPEFFTIDKKGKYTCRVQFRHDDLATLEKFKNFPLLFEGQLAKDKNVAVNIYHTHYQAMVAGTKFTSAKQISAQGFLTSIFVQAPAASALPAFIEAGDNLVGALSFVKLPDQEKDAEITNAKGIKETVDGISLKFAVPQKPKAAPAAAASAGNGAAKPTFAELQSKFTIDHLNGLVSSGKCEDALKLAEEVAKQVVDKDQLLLKVIKLRSLDATITDPERRKQEVNGAADEVIGAIDQAKLAGYFGLRHTPEEAEATKANEELKKILIEALKVKVVIVAKILNQATAAATDEAKAQAQKDVQSALAELKKWTDTEAAEYIEFNKSLELAKGNLGAVLKLVRKEIANASGKSLKKQPPKHAKPAAKTSADKSKSNKQRQLYEAQLDILKKLDGFGHWVAAEELALVHRFPTDFALF